MNIETILENQCAARLELEASLLPRNEAIDEAIALANKVSEAVANLRTQLKEITT